METTELTKVYKWIKISGLLTFIPIAMAAYPLAGYFAARYLIERFGLPKFTMAALITIGFVASVRETIRIIRLAIKAQGKN